MVTKKQKNILDTVESTKDYSLSDAVKILQEHKSPKFDESEEESEETEEGEDQ